MKLKLIIVILFVLLLLSLVFVFGKRVINLEWVRKPVSTPIPTIALPTKAPEEIKIISEIKSHDVFIYDKNVKPKILGIKLHDQVRFVNKTSKEITVVGEGWGGVLLKPEENMTQAFDKVGRFEYKVTPSVSGEVVVE